MGQIKIINNRSKNINILYILILFGLALSQYAIIAIILNRGISCDEGYYLLGYLPNSPKIGVSDFHQIVFTLFGSFYGDTPDMFLRIVRYVWTIIASFVFALGFRHFLLERYQINALWIIPIISLSAAISFCFASPILYYDNIQMLLYLMLFAAFFGAYRHKNAIKLLCGFVMGLLSIFLLTNHLPSGILAMVAIVVLGVILFQGDGRIWISFIIGVLVSTILYHFCFTPIPDWINRVDLSLQIAKSSGTQHDNGSLIFGMLIHLAKLLGLMVATGGIYGLLQYLLYKQGGKVEKIGIWVVRTLLMLLTFILVYKLKWSLGIYIFYAIFSIALVDVWINAESRPHIKMADVLFEIALLLIPFAAVFGTNMPLHIRSLMFIPFWLSALVIILRHQPKIRHFYMIWSVIISVEIVLLMAVMDRYEYYGSPHKAACVLMDTPRLNDIYVTKTEKEYFENVYRQLVKSGFKPGDAILSSDENYIGVYAAGGVAAGGLHYDLGQLCCDPRSVDIPAPQFIIMYHRYYDKMFNFAHNIWGFPEEYDSIELGEFSTTLPNDCFSTLYVRHSLNQ